LITKLLVSLRGSVCTIHHLHFIAPSLHALASARNISLTLNPSFDVLLHRYEIGPGDEHVPLNFDERCDVLDKVLRFTAAQARAVRATRDGIALEQLLEAVMPLKAAMMRTKD